MITLFTGRPGSGKSYRVVFDLLRESVQSGYYIIHDVRGLKSDSFCIPAHVRTIQEIMVRAGVTYNEFFSNSFQEELCRDIKERYGKSTLIVIDEAYKYISKDKGSCLVDREIFLAWLAQHRHNGQDVWLITQTEDQIYKPVLGLIRERIHAKHGILLSRFLYSHYEGDQKISSSYRAKQKPVFEAYQSFQVASQKPSKSYRLHVLVCVALICIGFVVNWARSPFTGSAVASEKVSKEGREGVSVVDVKAPGVNGKKNSVRVKEKEPESLAKLITEKYSWVGVVGRKILVQSVEGGHLGDLLDSYPEASVLDYDRTRAVVVVRGEKVVLRRQAINVTESSADRKDFSDRPALDS